MRRTIVLVFLIVLAAGLPAGATKRGIVLDQDRFQGGVPDGYTPSSDFDTCEYRRGSSDGVHFQKIYGAKNDRCNPHTTGAPGKGDVSIYRRYNVNEGEWYKAWAVGEMNSADNAIGVVKMLFRTEERMVGECYGKIETADRDTAHTGETRYAPEGYSKPQLSDSGGCKVPNNVVKVSVAFRVRATEPQGSGKALLYHLRFGRCRDNGDCSNVAAP